MIEYSNIRRYNDLDFDDYLEIPGMSFSYLKGERYGQAKEVPLTHKIRIGKMVDAILTEDGRIDMADEFYPIARSIAEKIKAKFGEFIVKFEKQISYSADAIYNGYKLSTKGRLDYLLPGMAVIDLKVTHVKADQVRPLIKFMQYDNQLWNYANMAQVKRKYIMIHSVPSKTTEMVDMGVVTSYNEFWQGKIEKFGTPVNDTAVQQA